MKTNKLTLLTVATIATATLGVKGVNADESDRGITPEIETVTTNQSDTASGTESTNSATEAAQPTDSNNDAGSGSTEAENNEREGLSTSFEKSGNVIEVKNPEVVVDQSKGTGKYQSFSIEYKDVHFPDDLEINEGDKVTFTLPKEVAFQTSFTFDVHNPENTVVGQATADSQAGTVTTVFNDYFKNHPLNKQMSLKMDAKWTDKVQSGQPVSANFNGTIVNATIGKEQEIGSDELLSKWGSQDKDDPSVINWTVRVNYARKVLNYVKLIDEMSENQKLVDDYFVINNVESIDPWVDKGSAMDLVKSISKSDHGFEITMDRLDKMIYIWYKTRLTNAVKDSTNPTNKIELKAESDGAISKSHVQLVGGRGDASGENKPDPVFEIPNEAPVYDKPSIDLNDIPLMPPAPVLEKPEWKGGTTPFDAPQLDKPEWEGGVVPFDAPILEKPEINIKDIPLLPPAPVLDKPELVIDIPEPKQDKPNTPSEKTDKPNTPTPKETPKTEEVKITNRVKNHAQNTRNESEEVEVYSAPATLPSTGSDFGIAISLLGLLGLSLGVAAAKKEN
ncbi:collagen binding domain-containing protein [Streptococcus parasanguinis]|uniref:SIALI-17 repeat-containing surface protein n=1 Tax=Streptococcus parasanguinis TaxID=1318 RepID=UPI0039C46276